MANAVWPPGITQWVDQGTFREILPNPSIRSEMDSGDPKTRRRFSAVPRQFSASIECDDAEYALFYTFYTTAVYGDALPFDWVHPIERTLMTFKFNGEISRVVRGGQTYRLSFNMTEVL